MDSLDLERLLAGLDREQAQILERSAEIDRDRAQIRALLADNHRIAASIAAKYNMAASPSGDTARKSPVELPQLAVQPAFNGSINDLINRYLTHPESPIHGLRPASKQHYGWLLKRIGDSYGIVAISGLDETHIQRMHDDWSDGGQKLAIAHALITMFRTLVVFGATVLKEENFQRLAFILHRMKFKAPKPHSGQLTAEQATAIIEKANEDGLHSLALAQAIQFWCPLRQKDIIGEWIPITEPDESDVLHKDLKWISGIRWEGIDESFVLHHVTSWERKPVRISLLRHPTVAEQIARTARRKSGAVIVSEASDLPWRASEFRRQWRIIARKLGVPDDIKYKDTGSSEGVEEPEIDDQLHAENFSDERDIASRTLN
jgi:hypothetical protein